MRDLRKFIRKSLWFTLPLWLHLAIYVVSDPFMVIFGYENYYTEREIPLALDRDYVSTMTYVQNRENCGYNSFIFGNSRSMYYPVADWQSHLGDSARCYHFDASAESLYGVLKKVQLIDRKGDQLKNALFVIDASLLEQVRPQTDSHLFYVAPILENYHHLLGFHFAHWKTFLHLNFAYAVCDYCLSHEVKDYMVANHFMENYNVEYELESNEVTEESFEQAMRVGTYYTPERLAVFEDAQTPGVGAAVIQEEQRILLFQLRDLLEKHQCDFKIVISPLYNQVQLNPEDLVQLQTIFGAHRVFDYSGVNSITADYRNYYEAAHYRPVVAQRIMDEIYQ